LAELFPLSNAASTDLTLSSDKLPVADDTSSFPDGMTTNEGNVVLLVYTLNTALQIPKLMIVAIMIDTCPPQLQICILTQELSFLLSRTLRVILLISLLCNLCLLLTPPYHSYYHGF